MKKTIIILLTLVLAAANSAVFAEILTIYNHNNGEEILFKSLCKGVNDNSYNESIVNGGVWTRSTGVATGQCSIITAYNAIGKSTGKRYAFKGLDGAINGSANIHHHAGDIQELSTWTYYLIPE